MIRDSESRITFLPFSPKKWSGYLRRPQAESRKLGPARPEGQGPESNPESRITFLPFSPKKWSGYLRRPQAESRKLGPARPEGQGPESRIPNPESRFCHFRQKNGPGTSEDRKPNPESLARPGPRAGARITNPESRITFLPFSPKKWSGYLRRPQAESRKLGPARPEGQGPESRGPESRITFSHYPKKMVPGYLRRPSSRILESLARPGPGARITNPESRITFLPFSPKKWSGYLRRPQAESRKLGPARPEGQGPESRIPNPESRFCHFRQKNGPGTSEDRKPNPESLARPGPRGRGPNHESRIPNHVSAIFAKKMVRVPPKTASRIPKAWPGPARGAGARITNPESRFCHFRQKNGPGTSEDRKPNPESLARPGPRGRGPNHESRIPNHVSAIFAKKMVRVPPKTASRIPKAWPGPARGAGARITNPESRITFLPFSPKKWSGYLRRPQAESRKLGPARPEGQGPESRIPNHVSAIFAKKMVRVPPKTASRIPKAWPGPARGAGARITNPESRFCHFRQKNGPGTSEDRKPNPESLARPGPRGRGPNHESRIPNHVSAIFAKKMVRVPPKTASRIPKAWPGPARGAGARITNPESRITFLPFSPKKMVRVPPKTASRIPKAWPGPARGARFPEPESRIPNPESRFCHFRQKNGPGTSEDRKPNPESLARPGPRGRGPNHESRIPNPESRFCIAKM